MVTDAVRSASLKVEADIQEVMRSVLGQEGEPSMRLLLRDWASLTVALDLLQIRAERDCPHCGHTGFADATRCGYCWAALPPELAVPTNPGRRPSESRQQEEALRSFENEGGAQR